MKQKSKQLVDQVTLKRQHFQQLLDALSAMGYRTIGPSLQNGAIVLDDITSVDDLPIGWRDIQESASYRIEERRDEALFGFVVGPQSWKKYLYPAEQILSEAKRTRSGWKIDSAETEIPKYAFVGVRSCEIHALFALDKIFMESEYFDPGYKARRENALIVAVNCGEIGGTCFCASMGTGPKATGGFDLALTEVVDASKHYFVVDIGTEKGQQIIDKVTHETARKEEIAKAESITSEAAKRMGRSLDTSDLKDLLYRNIEHSHWKDVASRCLTCANCTMVCPTCFCTTMEDYTDLSGQEASRLRKCDSCFTMDYSYIIGGSVRYSTDARYRQWLMHKFANWIDQYGTFGCVGCGRCITWCPAGIDVTEELRIIRVSEILETTTASTKEQ